jgi:cytochrome P450
MELATAETMHTSPAPRPELPPGPDWSLPRLTWRWWRRPLQTMEECQRRFGDMFTYRLPHEGTWVMISDPAAIKQVFTGDPRLLHAGRSSW